MTREDEIRGVLVEILYHGLLGIRAASFSGNTEACYAEADHLHNLPHLIGDFREELLTFYCDVERPCYLRSVGRAERYESLWKRLDALRASPADGSPSAHR